VSIAAAMTWQVDVGTCHGVIGAHPLVPIGPMIRQTRESLGLSQYTLAGRLHEISGDDAITREHVSRWERGERIPRPYWRGHLSGALQIPRQTLDQAAALARSNRARAAARDDEESVQTEVQSQRAQRRTNQDGAGNWSWQAGVDHGVVRTGAWSRTLVETFDLWDGLMRRRDLLIGAGAAAAGLSLGADLDLAALAATGGGGLDPETLAAHADLQAAHGRIDNLHGPVAVHAPATAHHRQLLAWYPNLTSDAERHQLAGLLAVTGGFLGWLSFDLGRYGEAATWFRQAAGLAADVGDTSLCANNIGQASRALAHAGLHDDARRLADAAITVAGTAAHPAVRSWLHGVRAYHHALAGDRRTCLADLRTASAVIESVSDDKPGYIGYVDHAEIQKWAGHALVTLGTDGSDTSLLRSGGDAIKDADAHWRPTMVRGRAEVIVTRARAALATGHVDEAAAHTWDAYRISKQTNSRRNQQPVRRLHLMLTADNSSSPVVRELTERMEAV
jgi:putative transcriptional regulator